MNKILAGSIIGGAGIALLLGGGGTFALWQSSASVDASSITSGTLSVAPSGSGVWTNRTAGSATDNDAIDPSTFRIVPGDTLEYSQDLTITATGDDLKAKLSYDPSSIGLTGANASAFTTQVSVTPATGTTNVVSGGSNAFTVSPAAGTSTVHVVLTLTMPSTVSGTTAQSATVDLSGLTFTLDQTAS